MSQNFRGIEGIRLETSEDTRQRHLSAISAEIDKHAHGPFSSRRLLAVVVGLLVAFPVAALASDGAVPGDFLYPVKRIVEPVIGIFDRDVAATHRVQELEQLVADQAPYDVLQDSLDRATAVVDPTSDLWDRLDEVSDRVNVAPGVESPGPDTDLVPAESTTTAPPDASTVTTRPTDVTSTTGITRDTPPGGDDRTGD
jgi:hypothetical protein